MKTKLLIAGSIILVIIVGVVAGASIIKTSRLNEQLTLGENYLLEHNYQQAILSFQNAIEIEPKSQRAILGLARAYIGLNNPKRALEMLENFDYQDEEIAGLVNELLTVNEVILEQNELTLYMGQKFTFSASIVPTTALNQKVSWSSSDSSIVSVCDEGVVTALGEGTVIVAVTTEDGQETAQCTVHVPPSTRGNSVGNIYNQGLAAYYEGWIYYRGNKEGHMYRIRSDGSEKEKLNKDDSMYISVYGDRIFYLNKRDGRFYSMRLDGSQRTRITHSDTYGSDFQVVDGWIYWRSRINSSIQSIRVDGSQNEVLASNKDVVYGSTTIDNVKIKWDGYSLNFLVVDGWVYYHRTVIFPMRGLHYYNHRMRPDGTDSSYISMSRDSLGSGEGVISIIDVVDEWIYYVDVSGENRIFRARINGRDKTQINDDPSAHANLQGDWIYYSNQDDFYSIYKIRIDGTGRTKLNNEYSININVVDGWIYYIWDYDKPTAGDGGENGGGSLDETDYDNTEVVTRMRLDGSEKQRVE